MDVKIFLKSLLDVFFLIEICIMYSGPIFHAPIKTYSLLILMILLVQLILFTDENDISLLYNSNISNIDIIISRIM